MGILGRMFTARESEPTPRPAAVPEVQEPVSPPMVVFEAPRIFNQLRIEAHRFQSGEEFRPQDSDGPVPPRHPALTAAIGLVVEQVLAGRGLVPEHPFEIADRTALPATLTFFGFRVLEYGIGMSEHSQLCEAFTVEWIPTAERLTLFNAVTARDLGYGEN